MKNLNSVRSTQQIYGLLLLLWACNVAAIFMYLFISMLIKSPKTAGHAFPGIEKYLVFAISAFCVFAAGPAQKKLFSMSLLTGGEGSRGTKALVSYIVLFGFCGIPAILGLILFIISKSTTDLYLLSGVSFAALVYYFPRRARWEEMIGETQAGA